MYRKRAKVATTRKLGSGGRRALADRWSAFVAWMRFSLLQRKPIPLHTSASATIKRAQRRDLTALFENIVDKAFYEALDVYTLKRVITLFLASARRGRQKLSLRELLKSPDKHRAKLLKFTMKRMTLVERADFPKPPGILMMERAEKFAEYEAAKKNGTWKKPLTALPVGPPLREETAAKAGPALIRDASGSSQAGVKSEPWPHSPAWEDMLWTFLGEWFSRDVSLALREPIVHRVSWLMKFNGLAPFRYLKVSFTTFPTVFSAHDALRRKGTFGGTSQQDSVHLRCLPRVFQDLDLPRCGTYKLSDIKTAEVDSWLRSIDRADGTKVKIRNLMATLFNHAIRWEFTKTNPITGPSRGSGVRQSGKRRKKPEVLSIWEIRSILKQLPVRLRTMIFLIASTGLWF